MCFPIDINCPSWSFQQPLVKAMVFPVVMYGCESWTIKKAGHQRIDAFELWCWKSLLRVPWTTRRSNQSIPKEISPEYSGRIGSEAETLVLWSPDAKNWLIRKDSDAGRDWGQEEKVTAEVEMVGCHHWLNGHQFDQASGDGEGQGPGVLQSVGSQRFRHNSVTEHKSCCEEMKKSYG